MPKLDAERSLAARVARSADLRDVRLFGVIANLVSPVIDAGLTYSLSSNVEYQVLAEASVLIVTGSYELSVVEAAPSDDDAAKDDSEPAKVADLSFQLAALFDVPEPEDGAEPFEDKEYEAYAATTGQFVLYPYAREFVAEMTGRMGLPPLHLGALKFQLDGRNED
ncbi:MAG: SecB chaperone [Jiangellaceae bacterium]